MSIIEKLKYTALVAISVDGKIARYKNHSSSEWTSGEDKVFMRKILVDCDVILIGNTTYKTAIKPLSKRNCIVFTRSVDEPKCEHSNLTYINPESTDLKLFIKEKEYRKVCVLGGSSVYEYCFLNNMIDELFVTVEPIIFGEGIEFLSKGIYDTKLSLISMKKINDKGTILLHYGVRV
jgi:dihydrofolate reductase